MPPAARVSDPHACPVVEQGDPHVGGPILPEGDPTVLIGFMPAARVGDGVFCKGATDAVAAGSPTVLIGHKQAARLGDPTTHGGVVVGGCPNVRIGGSAQADALRTDKAFAEQCEKPRDDDGGERA